MQRPVGLSAPSGWAVQAGLTRVKVSGAVHRLGPGRKAVLDGGAGDLFEIEVPRPKSVRGAGVLVGEIDAADAFVVGRERGGNAGGAVGGKGVAVERDAEDDVVRGEIDFDHDVRSAISLSSACGSSSYMTLTPWPMRSAWPRSTASRTWKRKAFEGDEAGRELAGVEREVDLRVDGVEEVDHVHLPGVLGHGEVVVFGLDEVEATTTVARGVAASAAATSKASRVWAKTRAGSWERRTCQRKRISTEQAAVALGWPQCSMELRWARASAKKRRSVATSSRDRRPGACRGARRARARWCRWCPGRGARRRSAEGRRWRMGRRGASRSRKRGGRRWGTAASP